MDVNIDMSDKVSGNMAPPPQSEQKNLFSSVFNRSRVPNIAELLREVRQNIRPWSEFLNMSNFKTVANIQRLSGRLVRNLAYFQSNYLFVFLGLVLYCLLTSPLILIVLGGVFYACYKVRQLNTKITILQRELNAGQQCILINCAAIPILYLAGAGAAMFWVLGASFFVISLHAVFYNIDAVVTEDTETFLAETV
ncbi:prenylated Rab acceptor protein 1 [Phlebotomus argentipes]|uniref:prenylated Rab acceptor protein 1 n=1 Tax=Phlebotomus argentipes TaxID=94469 RepID=UPI00289376EE|nr:prenylated Rab acceptor protein 1 [Phlebotomus argentipes]